MGQLYDGSCGSWVKHVTYCHLCLADVLRTDEDDGLMLTMTWM